MNITSDDYFNTMLYGRRDDSVADYFLNKAQAITQYIPQQYTELAETIQKSVEHVNSQYFRDIADSLTTRITSMWKGDRIRPLHTAHELAAAPPMMRRWVMAEPTVRKLYHEQACDGYSDTYVDVEPNAIGMDHRDYRNVTHGIINVNEDGSEHAVVYHSDMDDDEYVELTLANKVDILTTWTAVKRAVDEATIDPTSTFLTYL